MGRTWGDMGEDRSPAAANGTSQMWKNKILSNEDGDEFAEFACKETPQLFAHANKTPPFSEWQGVHALIKATPNFEAFEGAGSTKYFYHTDLEYVAMRLKEHQQNGERCFSTRMIYGKSPDIADLLIVTAQSCPEMRVKRVPAKYRIYQAI